MRITGPGRTVGPQSGGGPKRSDGGGGGFTIGGSDPAVRSTATMAPVSFAGLDALIALQSVDVDRRGGRRRAVKKGHDLLDILDELKLGLLSGSVSGTALDRIATLLGSLEATGDDALDALVADIALRAEVELAKLGRYLPDR